MAHYKSDLAGAVGIEPTLTVLETSILPLNYAPKMVEGDGFEPPNPKERIYSPPRLATSLPLQGMMPAIGVEPTTYWLQVSCSTNWATPAYMVEDDGLEPPTPCL